MYFFMVLICMITVSSVSAQQNPCVMTEYGLVCHEVPCEGPPPTELRKNKKSRTKNNPRSVDSFPVTTLIDNGPSDNRIDLVFIGDGYQVSELATYATHVQYIVDGLFLLENRMMSDLDVLINNPYMRYAQFFNVYRIDIPSSESGIDLVNPVTEVNTYFDCGQWSIDIQRLSGCDIDLAKTVATQSMMEIGVDITKDGPRGWIGLAMNTDLYVNGGAYAVAMFAGANSLRRPIMMHEAAHSWHNIADEYGGNPDVYVGPDPVEINVTADVETAKWSHWLNYQQEGNGLHAAWEGGRYFELGLYRPTNDSIMRAALTDGHNSPSLEKIIQDIYSNVNPLDDWSSNTELLPANTSLTVTPIDSNVIMVDWFVDGVKVIENSTLFDYNTSQLSTGRHHIEAVAYDEIVTHAFSNNDEPHPLDLVRTNLEQLERRVDWTVVVGHESSIEISQDIWSAGDIVTISLIDQDAMGMGGVPAIITTNHGDEEMIWLTENLPGQFKGSIYTGLGEVLPNAVIDIDQSSITMTVTYMDVDIEGGFTEDHADIKLFPSALVHEFTFEENEGRSTQDFIGEVEGTLIQNVEWIERHNNESAIKLPSTSGYIQLDTDLGTVLNGEASVAMYIKTTQVGGEYGWSSPTMIGSKYYGDCCVDIYWGWIDQEGHLNVSAGAWGAPAKTLSPVNDNEWHFVVMTRSESGYVEIYMDGILQDQVYGEGGIKSLTMTSLGRREDKNADGDTVGGTSFNGSLDDIRIFDRVLSRHEIDQLFIMSQPAPTAFDDTLELMWDEIASTEDVRLNDIFIAEQAIKVIGFLQPEHGTVNFLGQGRFEYIPAENFIGEDAFVYTISNGIHIATARVQINVLATPCDYVCDDDNPCTLDVCDGFGGCVSDGTGITIACDDYDPCTVGESCQGDQVGTCGNGMNMCMEAGSEAGVEAGSEAGVETGTKVNTESGTDTRIEAGTEADNEDDIETDGEIVTKPQSQGCATHPASSHHLFWIFLIGLWIKRLWYINQS